MKFNLKPLNGALCISKIANLHFFEFGNDFFTQNDKHPFYELIFISKGAMTISSDGYSGLLRKNQMIIHKPNETHSLECSISNAPIVIIVGFECESAELDAISDKPLELNENGIKKLAEIVKEGRNVFVPPYDVPTYDMKKKKVIRYGSEQMLKILLEYFLIDLIREHEFSPKQTDKKDLSFGFNVAEVLKYVNDNFLEKITIDELAFLFGTNRVTLCREFKKFTGKTFVEFVNDKKLELAKEKITSTDKTFTEIAYELNFETIHYFTRFFKKQTGLTPREYRNGNE